MASKARSNENQFPDPLFIEPEQLPHTQTIILLHGRGSTASKFGPSLLEHPVDAPSGPSTLRALFPQARFVFPTAPLTRATLYKRSLTHQWFDKWKHYRPQEPDYGARDDLQTAGLRTTTELLHGVLRAEINLVGANNVVFGGLSQGCAASSIALLLCDGPRLGAFVGMCGYLPFEKLLAREDGWGQSDLTRDDDPFITADSDESTVLQIREMLGLPQTQDAFAFRKTPIFLGHGTLDDKVYLEEGRVAGARLQDLGAETVLWEEYAGLGHWYSSAMLRDISKFLHKALHHASTTTERTVESDEGPVKQISGS